MGDIAIAIDIAWDEIHVVGSVKKCQHARDNARNPFGSEQIIADHTAILKTCRKKVW
jgi:hypothetical protein